MNMQSFIVCAIVGLLCQSVPVSAQDAILPHGDPRLRDQPGEPPREQAREQRLKQQGQGQDYRVEGKPQGGKQGSTARDPNGAGRQDTGISDPSVNPGQASGMRVVRGEVKQATLKTVVVEDANGKQTTMSIDAATAGDRDIRPGDVITGTVTGQGRAVALHKEAAVEAGHHDPGADGERIRPQVP
jgi:hypothetical protein